MQLRKKITLSVASLFAAVSPALAENINGYGPKWDVVEAGYVQADLDADDSSPSGFGAAVLKSLGDNFYLTGRYRDVSEEEKISNIRVDIELSQLSAGIGYKYAITNTTDIFAQVTFENLEATASAQGQSDSNDENGFGAAVGVRSMVVEQLEVSAQIGYIDIDDDSETAFGASAYYYVTDDVALGATYELWDGVDFMGLNLRYAF
tara:strand:+ start:595 stop:1212 length:618 start_codon:yes stop_codon:yes gene_type:complete